MYAFFKIKEAHIQMKMFVTKERENIPRESCSSNHQHGDQDRLEVRTIKFGRSEYMSPREAQNNFFIRSRCQHGQLPVYRARPLIEATAPPVDLKGKENLIK